MLLRHCVLPIQTCRRLFSTRRAFDPVRRLEYFDEENGFRDFITNEPALFKQTFRTVPAIAKWFTVCTTDDTSHELDSSYLDQHGTSIVPLELSRSTPPTTSFERFEAPFSLLLAHMRSADTPDTRLYLAQHSLADLPAALQADVPIPPLVARLGRGDIYASSLWMGRPPTRTPLHRDPNPNLFVQLAGRKRVRLMRPDVGRALYERVGNGLGRANMRGDEMMQGREMEALEEAVWEDDAEGPGVEAELSSGDGLYIPLGWWHAVHGVRRGANASVNWWFR
ncbi:hypothetical protein ACN47E_002676 [Coniothyrium glycines]